MRGIAYTDPFGLKACKDPKDLLCKMAEQITRSTHLLIRMEPGMLAVASLPTIVVSEGAPLALGLASAGSDATAAVPTAANPALSNTLKALFRAGDEIPGGTAGAIRNEAVTGQPTGGVFHLQKGIERLANLERILRREALSAADRATAEHAVADLRDAVKFAQEQAAK